MHSALTESVTEDELFIKAQFFFFLSALLSHFQFLFGSFYCVVMYLLYLHLKVSIIDKMEKKHCISPLRAKMLVWKASI